MNQEDKKEILYRDFSITRIVDPYHGYFWCGIIDGYDGSEDSENNTLFSDNSIDEVIQKIDEYYIN